MGKNRGPSASSGRAAHGRADKAREKRAHDSKGSGAIAKPPSALGAAIAAARKQQPKSVSSAASSSISSTLSLHLSTINDAAVEGDAMTVDTLLDLVRVVVQESGGRIPLTELGGNVRALAARRCLQAKFDGMEIHKSVKAKGGWENFVREHASAEFVVLGTELCKRVSLPAVVEPTFAPRSTSKAATSSDVNALSLSGAQL